MTELIIKYFFQNKKDTGTNYLILPTHKYKIFCVGELTALFLTNGLADEFCHFRFKDQLEGNIVWVDIKNEGAPLPISKVGEVEIKILKVPYVCDHRGLKKNTANRKTKSPTAKNSENPKAPPEKVEESLFFKSEEKHALPKEKGQSPPAQAQANFTGKQNRKVDLKEPSNLPSEKIQAHQPNRSPSPKGTSQPGVFARSNKSSQEHQSKGPFEDVDFLKSAVHRPHSNNPEPVRSFPQNANAKDFDIFDIIDAQEPKKPKSHVQRPKANNDFDIEFGLQETNQGGQNNGADSQPAKAQKAQPQGPNANANELFDLDFSNNKPNSYFGTTRDEELIKKEQKMQAANSVDPVIRNWAFKNDVRKDLRSLLTTLHEILWPGCEDLWQPVQLTDILSEEALKKYALKAIVKLHPDKNMDHAPQRLYLLERVSNEVNLAYRDYRKIHKQ